MIQPVTHAFKDLVGVITNSVFGVVIPIVGGNTGGIGQVTISMNTERTAHDVAADGVTMVSYVAGDNGSFVIEVQQTSAIHHQLLDLYNMCLTAAQSGDVSGWAATNISLRTILDGSTHIGNGCSFSKIPDKVYQAQGQRISWPIMAAEVIQL